MSKLRFIFQTPADYQALERFAQRLDHPRFSKWPLIVQFAGKLPGAPEGDNFPVRRRRILVFESKEIRALQNFFEHELFVHGRTHAFVWPNGPLSESVVNKKYTYVWLALVKYSLELQPLQMLIGYLDPNEIPGSIYHNLGWTFRTLPYFYLPVKPERIAAGVDIFRKSHWDLQRIENLDEGSPRLDIEDVEDFGQWADTVWFENVGKYGAVTRRDAEALNRLYMPGDHRFHRIRVIRDGLDIGWIVVSDKIRDVFGLRNLRIGALVDAFCSPDDTIDVLRAGCRVLVANDVDMIFGHWSHWSWQKSCSILGFCRHQAFDTQLIMSPEMKEVLSRSQYTFDASHYSDGDCSGPYYLVHDNPDHKSPA